MATTRVDINTASLEELEQLPMIDDNRAKALLRQRPFHAWNEIDELPGFNSRLVEDLQKQGAFLGAQDEELASYLEAEEEEPEPW